MQSSPGVFQCVCGFVVLTACALETNCEAQTASVSVHVMDQNSKPLQNVSLSVYLWRRDWQRTEAQFRAIVAAQEVMHRFYGSGHTSEGLMMDGGAILTQSVITLPSVEELREIFQTRLPL